MIWKNELRPIDICDPATGEPLYVIAAIRPRWYWMLCRVHLFLQIVWRVADTDHLGRVHRLDVKTAWVVSNVAMGPEQ